MSYAAQKRILLFCFLFFPVALLLLFLVWPTVRMVYYSFTNWDGVLPEFKFIGISNYIRVFNEPLLWISLKNNLVYAVVGFIQNIVAIFFAVILNSRMRGRVFYKTVIFLPYVLNVTATAYMFSFLYDYREGPINLMMRALGREPIKFFSDSDIVIYSLAFISFWRWLGYSMILYISALQSIDPELYEASSIDGANSLQKFRFITFPGIIRVIELQLFLALSGSLRAFTESIILTKGGPGKASYTFLYYIIDAYSRYNDYGYAAAMSVSLVIIIIVIAGIQQLVIRRGED